MSVVVVRVKGVVRVIDVRVTGVMGVIDENVDCKRIT